MTISSLSKSAGTQGPPSAPALFRPGTQDGLETGSAAGRPGSFASHLAGAKPAAERDASDPEETDTGKDLPALAGNVLPDLPDLPDVPVAANGSSISNAIETSLEAGGIAGGSSEFSLARGAVAPATAGVRGTELFARVLEKSAATPGAPLTGVAVNASPEAQANESVGQSAARGENISSLMRLAGAIRMPEAASAAPVPAQNAAAPSDIAITVSFEPGIATAELLRSKGKSDAALLAGPGTPAVRIAPPEVSSAAARLLPEVAGVSESVEAPVVTVRAALEPAGGIAAFAAPAPAAIGQPASIGVAAQPGSTEAYNLDALIERIVEARQSSGGGRISLSVAHHEFGAVGIRLEHAVGAGLAGAALTSNDPAFAPAVHAALADRAAAERHAGQTGQSDHARADQQSARGDSSAQGGQPQAHGSRPEGDPQRAASTAALDEMFGSDAATGEDAAPIDSAAHSRGLFA